MPTVTTPDDHRFPWYARALFWLQRRRYGRVLEPARLWARTPKVFVAFAAMFAALERRSSPIDPLLRSLITVRISQINWCRYCVDVNASFVLERGACAAKLAELERFESSSLFSEREKAALCYAEAVTRSDGEIAPEVVARLRRHFDDDAIVELTAIAAFQNASSKFNAALAIEPQGFCALAPQPAPPPQSSRTEIDQENLGLRGNNPGRAQ
jgi:AhpD family alkylhydroperoxidase